MCDRSRRRGDGQLGGLLPWIDDVAAVLHIWYPGMEGGHALADVLLGTVEAAVACRS
ncbi:MAG: glycoside hydrolase family 3 C-terminal domain-containing protein [Acidimicrobiales bacterium]